MADNLIGSSIPRVDAAGKLRGRTRFPADESLPGMLWAAVLKSPVASARLLNLDISTAGKVPGVVKILTAADIPGENGQGVLFPDMPVLVTDRIRSVNDNLALVVGVTPEVCAEAVARLIPEYEELPAVFDPREALKPNAPLVHANSNLLYHLPIRKGNPDEGLARSAVVVEDTYTTQMVDHAFLQPEAALAYLDHRGHLVVKVATQYPHWDRSEIARALNWPQNKIQVVGLPVGGAFGGREDMTLQNLVALAAVKTLRPVKMVLNRRESFLTHSKRHPMYLKYKTGADSRGRLLALEAEIVGDTGAYASWAPNILRKAAVHATGPYVVENVRVDAYAVYTNNPFAGAMRGFGAAQPPVAVESQMDRLAEALGMDPLEIRRLNAFEEGSVTATGQVLYAGVGLKETMDQAARSFHWFDRSRSKGGRGAKKRGRGMACIFYGIGYGNGFPDVSSATVEIHDDGTATIRSGAVDCGQGSNTVLVQIAARELGLEPERVTLITADTDTTPDAGTTAATRQTYASGNAVRLAAQDAMRDLLEFARRELGLNTVGGLELQDGRVIVKGYPQKYLDLKELVPRARLSGVRLLGEGTFTSHSTAVDPETGQGAPYWPYAFGTQMAEVEVDTATGQIEVLEVVAAHDVGRAVNKKGVENQICGGVVQGLGYAILEEVQLSRGKITNPSFSRYLIPTAMDIPEIKALVVEAAEPSGPYGAKGVGEPAMLPTAAAILNAVYDATGVRFTSLPLTPEKVLSTLGSRAL